MTDTIQPGETVRYSRTGTSGVVVTIENRDGVFFAELDSTGLFYRMDQLVLAQIINHPKISPTDDSIEQIRKERDFSNQSDLNVPDNLDGACSGAG